MSIVAIAVAVSVCAAMPSKAYPDTPEGVIRALYDRVTWAPPAQPDWAAVREVFRPECVFSLRLSRDEIKVMDLDGFIREWIDYAKLEPVVKHGFQEKIVKLKSTAYGDIATVAVLYEASIPGYMKTPQQGVDLCHLVKKDGKWAVVSIINEVVTKDKPLPPQLLEG